MAINKDHYPLLLAICASLFSTPLMMAGINAVLPEIGTSLGAGATQLSLIGAVYSLGLAVFQLACGKLGDIWGHRRIFIAGGALFAASSAGAALLYNIPLFLFFRFLQGIGGAMLSATGLALLASAAPPAQRAAYLGFSGAAVYCGIACGPPLAGIITGVLGWRAIFWLNALTNLIVLSLMAHSVRHELRPAKGERFDWAGCVFYGIAMTSLTLAADTLASQPATGTAAIVAFACFIGLFWMRQNRISFPMLNTRILVSNRQLTLACVSALVNYASFFGIVFFFSFYLQIAKGLSAQEAGLILAFQPVMQAIGQPVATRLCAIWTPSPVSAIGAGICGVGLLAAAFIEPASRIAWIFLTQGLLGFGISLFSLANTTILLECAGQGFIGQASALTGAARTAGQLFSMACITFSLAIFLHHEPVAVASLPQFMHSMRCTLVVFGVLNLCAIGLALVRNYEPDRRA